MEKSFKESRTEFQKVIEWQVMEEADTWFMLEMVKRIKVYPPTLEKVLDDGFMYKCFVVYIPHESDSDEVAMLTIKVNKFGANVISEKRSEKEEK